MKSESWADYLQEMWSTSKEAKCKSKGPIYILHLFALAAIGLFLLYIFNKKGGVRESHGWKKCGRRDFRRKKASLIERSPIQHWGHRTPEQKK